MDESIRDSSTDHAADAVRGRPPAPDTKLNAPTSLMRTLDSPTRQAAAGPATDHQNTSHDNQLVQVRMGIASSLFSALRAKHAPTASHSLRVALATSSWVMTMELENEQRDEMEVASLVHDIGKIGVPDQILQNPGKLTREEFALMNQHRSMGLDILRACCASREILDIVRYAPAWFDGSRDRFDRSGTDLPLGSRIISIVDAFDAMTTDQVHRRALSRERAMAELFDCAGTQFDPQLVRKFVELESLDQAKLHLGVVRRWLQQLDPEMANSRWRLGRSVTMSAPRPVDALFNEKLFDNMYDGVVFVDSGLRIVRWNRAAERLTGIPATSVTQTRWLPGLVDMWDERKNTITDDQCPVAHAVHSGVQALRRLVIAGRHDNRVSVDAHIIPVVGSDGTTLGATLVLHDVSSEADLEERVQALHKKATRDALTKVHNRAEFDHTCGKFLQKHLARGEPCSLIISDLDHFKQINDTYGHQAGDEALVRFAALLQRSCRRGDLVARYGGEEFVMLCADCDNASAAARAEQIRRELASMPQSALEGKRMTASFGVTEVQMGDTPESMLRRADRGVYQAKELGRNTVVQLGIGIRGHQQSQPTGNWWRSWLENPPADLLLEQNLYTTVPLNLAIEKLRGFVADHRAEIVSIEGGRVVVGFNGKPANALRRLGDRSVSLLTELFFAEKNFRSEAASDRGASAVLRTAIHVTIRPERSRDRRRRNAVDSARQLLSGIKSYLMAHEIDPGQLHDEANARQADPASGLLDRRE